MARMTSAINPQTAGTARVTIGSRGSPLALVQAREVKQRLEKAYEFLAEEGRCKIETIVTKGDKVLDRPLSSVGGKEIFTKEIEDALLDGRIDLAQHCLKDLPTEQPPGLIVGAILPREDPRDAFISKQQGGVDDLPERAKLGTSSLRRAAFLKAHRPDLQIVDLRGNVDTRLAKIERGDADATILAVAGLKRLGLDDKVKQVIDTEIMLPAPGQGIIALECREDDDAMREMLAQLTCQDSLAESLAERALLAALDGSCRTPIAALAERDGQTIRLRAAIARPDGSEVLSETDEAGIADATEMGDAVGRRLRGRAGPGFFG